MRQLIKNNIVTQNKKVVCFEQIQFPVLSKSPKKLQNPENRQEFQFHFENRYNTTFMHLGHLIATFIPAEHDFNIDEDS